MESLMTLLQEAEQLINGQRQEDYGDAKACFKRIAWFWQGYLDFEVDEHDVAAMMVLFKMARISHNNTHRDSWLDAIGYCALTERLKDKPSF